MKLSTRMIVLSGMLGAISIVLGATGLGLIPVPTPGGRATIMHVPAILGGVLEGPVVGLLIGLIFGIFSFLTAPTPMIADPLVAILPRILIGVGAYYIYYILKGWNRTLAWGLAGIAGTAVNTVGVLGLAVMRGYLPWKAALAVAFTHGLPEAVVAAVLVAVVGKILANFHKQGFDQPGL